MGGINVEYVSAKAEGDEKGVDTYGYQDTELVMKVLAAHATHGTATYLR